MENHQDLVERLRTVKHFQSLSPADLYKIVTAGHVHRFIAGQTIFTEGESCSGMFVLLQGCVHLCKFSRQGKVNIISVIDPIIMFNEVAALDGGSNPLTAIAVENSLLWQIGHDSFQFLLKQIPEIGLSLLSVLARRNRQMIGRYEDLSSRSVMARTAKLLLDLSNYGHQTIQRRECSLEEMASRVATVPEAISRSLNLLKNSAAIHFNRLEITVISIEKLAELAQVDFR